MGSRFSNKKVSRPSDRGKHTAATLWFSKMGKFPQLPKETQTAMAVFAREGRKAQEKLEELERQEKKGSETEELLKLQRIGEEARENLILHTTRLATWFVNKQAIKEAGRMAGLEFMDLIQSAHEGLTIAVDKFDPDRNVKFSTYAFYWMRQCVLRQITQNGDVHVPEWVYNWLNASEAALEFIEQHGRNPTDKERIEFAREHKQATGLAEKMLEKKEEVHERIMQKRNDLKNALAIARNVRSLQQELSDGGGTLEEIVGGANPEKAMVNKLSIERMKQLLFDNAENLNERERQILYASYFYGATLQKIGNEMGITRERVRQIRAHALARLRLIAEKEGLTNEYGKTIPGTQQLGTFRGNPRKKPGKYASLEDKITFLKEQGVPKRIYSKWNLKNASTKLLQEVIPKAKEEKLLEFLPLDKRYPRTLYNSKGIKGFLKAARNRKETGSNSVMAEMGNRTSLKDKIVFLKEQGVPKRIYSKWNVEKASAKLLQELIPRAKEEKLLEFLPLDVSNPNNLYYNKGIEGFLKNARECTKSEDCGSVA